MIKCDARVTPMISYWCSMMFYVKDIYLVHALLVLMFPSVAVFCEMSEMSRNYQMH